MDFAELEMKGVPNASPNLVGAILNLNVFCLRRWLQGNCFPLPPRARTRDSQLWSVGRKNCGNPATGVRPSTAKRGRYATAANHKIGREDAGHVSESRKRSVTFQGDCAAATQGQSNPQCKAIARIRPGDPYLATGSKASIRRAIAPVGELDKHR